MKHPHLRKLLARNDFPKAAEDQTYADALVALQLRMLRVQQGLFHQNARAIVALEGFDAAGKGGAIRRLTETLDPRGLNVWAVGAPSALEQGTHYLSRFWAKLPHPGSLAIFDRTWYGRVLVERVERLTPKHRWKEAYRELRAFERMLVDDGVTLVKIFLAVSKREQLRRFEERAKDPYKHWKLNPDDLRARRHWEAYVDAADEAFAETSTEHAPWHLVPADDKPFARRRVLELVTGALDSQRRFIEGQAAAHQREIARELAKLSKASKA